MNRTKQNLDSAKMLVAKALAILAQAGLAQR